MQNEPCSPYVVAHPERNEPSRHHLTLFLEIHFNIEISGYHGGEDDDDDDDDLGFGAVQTPRYMTFWKKYRLHLHG
jgi:hypothetical protein